MVDTVLSSPTLPTPILDTCKVFFFVTLSDPPSSKRLKRVPAPSAKDRKPRERIVSVVVAQPIKVGMKVLCRGENVAGQVNSGDGVVCE